MRRQYLFAWVVGILVITLIFSPSIACAQNQAQINFELLSEENLVLPQEPIRTLLIEENGQVVSGQILFSEDQTIVSLPNRPSIKLPYILETVVAKNGQTIVQYGDELDQSHPTRTNIYWTDDSGNSIAQVIDYYAEEALVSLSEDGFTAVTGALFEDRDTKVLSLYSPTGEKLWEIVLGQDQRPSAVRVTEGGKHVALVTTNNQRWLADHRLHIIDELGKTIALSDDFHIIQKIVIADGAGKYIFVQGYNDYGLIDTSNGALLWRKPERIRMVSPYGAKVEPQGDLLFLVLADFQGKSQPTYRWELIALNVSDGMKQFSVLLPGEFPGTVNRVFEQVSSERLQIRTPSKRFTYSWQRR